MKDLPRTNSALIKEISFLKQRIQKLEQSESDLKLVKKALLKSEEKYWTLFEESFDGLFITSPEGKILDMNKKGIAMFGYDTKEEVLSLDLEKDVYANPSDRKRILALVNEQDTAEYEVLVKKKNGETMITHCSLTAVKEKSGVITSYRGIIRDITERKQTEEKLKVSEDKYRELPCPIAEIALQHHEKLDGSGYPQGLKNDRILLESRIIGVADAVEAMASHRPYRPGCGMLQPLKR